MRNEGVGSWAARRARRTPERVAVVHDGRRITYAELSERAARRAHALRALGVQRGDRVAYLGPNHPSFLETLFAAGLIGALFVPVNTRLAAPEIEHCLADSGSRVLLYAPSHAGPAARLRQRLPGCALVALAGPREGEHGYQELLAAAPAEPPDEALTLADPFMIMYTSGTTGRAKGAVLTHGNITWNALNVLVDADFRGDEVALAVAPLFHTAGLNMLCLPALLKGGTVVVEEAFDPGRAVALIEQEHVTSLFGVPAMYEALAAQPRWPSADLSSLRMLLCGGAPVPAATIRAYLARGLAFIQGYGMTEASPGVLLLDAAHVETKAGSAGVPHFFTDVRVAGPGGRDAAVGEAGEILAAGPNVMAGYWGQPEATAAALPEGWLRTGDAGVCDKDGYITVVDRIKDMIISGGENIYPAEVENVLCDHPAVAECGVIGVPDARWGEAGRAVVVLRPGAQASEEELLEFLAGRIARYKIPKSVRFAAALPRSGTGKILKKELRGSHGS